VRFRCVSFLSDFGPGDELVGVVHAVLADLAPDVLVVDLSHAVPPFDIRAGALALARCTPYVPAGVILAAVDPGVGTGRRAVAIEVAGGQGVFVGPDNGLLAPAVALAGGAERAVVLTNDAYHLPAPGPTFSARDVFAPVAAHVCLGVDLGELGDAIEPGLLLPGVLPLIRSDAGEIAGEVLWVDRFGNVQLNVEPSDIDGWGDVVSVRFGDDVRTAHLALTYDAIGSGVGLVVDAHGLVSVALARRSAADELGLAAGTQVRLVRLDDGPDRGAAGASAAGVTTPVNLRPRQ
jgi:S-adenosyl-L-methionine hydrolase (adenosine-forming)